MAGWEGFPLAEPGARATEDPQRTGRPEEFESFLAMPDDDAPDRATVNLP